MMDWTSILSAIGTFAAVLVALWVTLFGPRRVTKPKLSVEIQPEAPDCMWVSSTEESMRDAGSDLGHYVIRPRVINEGNEDARDVEVSMIRLRSNDGGKWLIDPLFLPLVLRWSWWPERSHSAGWLRDCCPERLNTMTSWWWPRSKAGGGARNGGTAARQLDSRKLG
jgi:hypothetical protein